MHLIIILTVFVATMHGHTINESGTSVLMFIVSGDYVLACLFCSCVVLMRFSSHLR
jgi:hypothetical protein